jgi:surface carbohydrate biosynthesis protein (TIGR04326 family)
VIGHAGIPRRVKNVSDESRVAAGQFGICLVDYMAHFAPGAVDEGRFASNYWGPLVEMLDELDEPVRWLHISADLASSCVVTRDDELVRQFDANATRQIHDLLHRHLTWAVLARSCRDYLRVRWFGVTAGPRARMFFDARNSTSFWQAFRAAYRDQFFGKTAMLNCLWLNLFEEALERIPPQRLAIYLFENQPWEMAFIHAWREAGHGELLGIAHSTTRFWDTRYFKDPRELWSESGANPMPWPHRIAVNGPLMERVCRLSGYPAERMVELEALRYIHIVQERPAARTGGDFRILVSGDYSPTSDEYLMRQVSQALDLAVLPILVSLRPHPAANGAPLSLDPRIRMDEHASVFDALMAADTTVCGALSTVAVESACMGKPTLLVADPHVVMTSPAEGLREVEFFLSSGKLAKALRRVRGDDSTASTDPAQVFHLDSKMSLWRGLVSAQQVHSGTAPTQ